MRFLCKIGIHRWSYEYKNRLDTEIPKIQIDGIISFVILFHKDKNESFRSLSGDFFDYRRNIIYGLHKQRDIKDLYIKQRICKSCYKKQQLFIDGWKDVILDTEDIRDKKLKEILDK